jgi:hypothetical protein
MGTAPALAEERRLEVVAALGLALVGTLTLAELPRRLHLSPTAGLDGFDPAAAHLLLVAVSLACVALGLAFPTRLAPRASAEVAVGGSRPPVATLALVAALVFAFFILIYFPPFLARYGPYGEDKYFLSALQRFQAGQQPYSGFEFLYGPLLIYPAARWMDAFGYSLASYYSLLALVEAATFAGLALALGLAVPGRRRWLAVLLVSVILLLNDNLGLSWIALRRLLPIVVLLGYALQDRASRGWLAVALLLGVQVVLSLEYAAACMIAIGGAAALEALGSRSWRPLLGATRTLAAGLVAGAALAYALMGPAVPDWLLATWRVVVLRSGGEASFPFGLSVNAFAVLALLFLACVRVGAGLPDVRRNPLQPGDRFLLAALAYALIAAKSGMARSDMYHLVPPVLGLVAVALLPLRFAVFPVAPPVRRVWVGVVVLVCATYAPGLLGAGRLWAQGLVLGAVDVATGRPASGLEPARSRGPRIGSERTVEPPTWVALAEYLAAPARARAPVLFYEQTWGLDRHVGVPKPAGIYPVDDYLVSDEVGAELRTFLEDHPEALVVIDRGAWERLQGGGSPPAYRNMFWIGGSRSLPVRVLEHWSSSHFGTAVVEELARKRLRWAETVGWYVRDHYVPAAGFGDVLVLERRP